jgi:hypothetical protein
MKMYILKNKVPVETKDRKAFAKAFELDNRQLAHTQISKNIRVSTVFLGYDHSFNGGTPVLFETMIFGGRYDQHQDRYTTWDAAQAGHLTAVAMAERKSP